MRQLNVFGILLKLTPAIPAFQKVMSPRRRAAKTTALYKSLKPSQLKILESFAKKQKFTAVKPLAKKAHRVAMGKISPWSKFLKKKFNPKSPMKATAQIKKLAKKYRQMKKRFIKKNKPMNLKKKIMDAKVRKALAKLNLSAKQLKKIQ